MDLISLTMLLVDGDVASKWMGDDCEDEGRKVELS